jgi:glycogen debranching enzyme
MDDLFDLARIPFSTFGSWISISIPRDRDELFFRNHHGGPNDLFPLQIVMAGEVVRPVIEPRPWVLTLTHGAGHVEICFERPGTVRMRGHGLSLRLGAKNITHREGPTRIVFNCPFTRRYQVEILHGSIELRHVDEATPLWAKQAIVHPAEDDRWELAMDEFESTWERPDRSTFGRCLESAKQSFDAFLGAMPAVRAQDRQAQILAAYVDWSCTVEPCGLVKRPSVLMSKNWMSNVWSWDHCFNAIALAAGHPSLALDQMLTMVDHQDEFGCYPDSINDVNITYNFSKPPVHGLALGKVMDRLPAPPSGDTLETLWSSLSQQVDWWMTHRCRAGNRLPHYLHGNDSGWDNSTMFAAGVPLVAPDLSALLIVQMDVLAKIAGGLGRVDASALWTSRADALLAALIDELWRNDHFIARLSDDGSVVESSSLIPWMPIILGARLPREILKALKRGIETHLTDWGLATERVDSPLYREDGYWQGPIWAPSTYIAVAGLDSAGYPKLADEISEKFCRLCNQSGFAENFHAQSGKSLRDPAYTWTASVFLLLAERLNRAS